MHHTLKIILISIVALFAPIHSVLLATLALLAVDFCTGLVAAVKRGEQITSAGFKQSVIKLFVYEIAILVGYLAEHFLMGDFIPVTKLIATLVGVTELLSIAENLNSIQGSPVLSTIIHRLSIKKDAIQKDGEEKL